MLITAVLFAAALGFVARGLATKPASAEEAGKMSDAFERFRFSFFEDQDFLHNGLDRKSLAKLEGDERKRAEALLIDYLPDMRGVIGLGVLRSKRAEEKLTSLFRAAVAELALAKRHSDSKSFLPLGSIEVGRALWFIDPDPRWVAPLIDILASTGHPVQRQMTVLALYDVRDPAVAQALIKALDDPDHLVRYHAARSTRDLRYADGHYVLGQQAHDHSHTVG